jgi:hypothetical protein
MSHIPKADHAVCPGNVPVVTHTSPMRHPVTACELDLKYACRPSTVRAIHSCLPPLWTLTYVETCTQAFHSGVISRAEEKPAWSQAAINPLQQTPVPVVSKQVKETQRKTAYAIQRDIPMSPKKLRLFPPLLRRRHVADALVQCRVSPKKAGRICEKVWDSTYLVERFLLLLLRW